MSLVTESSKKSSNPYFCKFCNYFTSRKNNYEKHIITAKHIQLTISDENSKYVAKNCYNCIFCNKQYQSRNGLWKHKQKCNMTSDIIKDCDFDSSQPISSEMILHVLKQNQELQQMMIEQNKTIMEMSKNNQVNTINNSNSNNKTFNLQVFLNETCKDAMNIMDFVDSLQIQLSDLENVGRNGFVAGISDIILKNLRALDITQRPIHCSDQKREIVYIKDDNQWHKEHPDNAKLKKAIKYIAHKNTCLIKEWKAKYPDCGQAASRKSDLYNKIVYEAMSLDNANAEKIIKRIAKEIGIVKS
jgi:hypothetical protein